MRRNNGPRPRGLRAGTCALLFAILAAPCWSAGPTLEPAFPPQASDLVFVEAEDAVSTNFAREPTLTFGASGYRALQLNRSTGVEGIASFYADYVFTVPSAGTWELWYGGTTPGPGGDSLPSYTSPFKYTVDAGKPVQVTQETDTIVGTYSPGYYWNRVADITLDAARHTLRFEVTEKRRIDARYYFYLDCFFLVRKEGGKRVSAGPFPAVFPDNLDAKGMAAPFLSIDDSLIKMRDNPGKTGPLVDISLSYTFLGDYLNALKYLNRAASLDPKDPAIALLVARNRIWKGDTEDGLRAYRDLLQRDPRQRLPWLEAGKVAAWAGRFDESITFFRDGLAQFPADTDLTVNLGLTFVWAGRGQDAEVVFRRAETLAGSDSGKLKGIARAYRVNGYPDRAVKAYESAIKADPRDLECYLLLNETLQTMGKKQDAAAVMKRISDTFAPSEQLSTVISGHAERESLRDDVMAQYAAKLDQNPDNLVLRQLLAQTYFWNGMKTNAIDQYRHILDNHAYIAVREMEQSSVRLLSAIDTGALLMEWLARSPGAAQKVRAALADGERKLTQAIAARDAAAKSLDKAKAAQAAAKPGKDSDTALESVHAAEDALVAAEDAAARGASALAAIATGAGAFAATLKDGADRVDGIERTLAELRPVDAAAEGQAGAAKNVGWRFDRSATLADFGLDLADNPLARLLSARIYLMDSQHRSVETVLAPIAQGDDARFVLARSRLEAGRVTEAAALIRDLATGPIDAAPAYLADLAALAASLAGGTPAAAPTDSTAAADATAAAAAAVRDLAGLEGRATALQERLTRAVSQLRTLYRHAFVRSLHIFDERVESLRNELGDYYLAGTPPQLDEAISQFNKVLAVDPGDLSATFRLGKVYQWKGDWKSALDSYAAVYAADPTYENVASLYNEVARDHADTISSLASYLADPQRVDWHGEAVYSLPVSSAAGLSAAYRTDSVRVKRGVGALSGASSYQLHDVSLGFPLTLFGGSLRVTPTLGGVLEANGLLATTDAAGASVSTSDSYGTYGVEPYARLDSSVSVLDALYLTAGLRWGRQPETWDPLSAPFYDASAEVNLTTLLSFIDAWPLHDTSFRTYGKVDYLHTSAFVYENLIATALQEMSVNLLKGGNPYSVLTITASVMFQHSDRTGSTSYYAPPDVFTAGASLSGSTWIGAGAGDVLGLTARIYGGSYQESVFGPSPVNRIKGEAEADISLTRGNGTYSLAAVANATYNAALASPWDYWSAFVRLGYTAKLPRLLAP